MRIAIGAGLVAVAVVAFVHFHAIGGFFLFLSRDGVVEPFMLLMLRLVLMSLGAVGSGLLLAKQARRALQWAHDRVAGCDRRTFLISAVTVSLLCRLAAVIFMPFQMWDDALDYDELAQQWAATGDYVKGDLPTAYRPPGYPFFLSRLYLIFGHGQVVGTLANVLLGTAIVLLTYFIVRRLWTEQAARWSAVLMALFPSQILFSNLLNSELLFTALFLGALLLFIHAAQQSRWFWLTAVIGGGVLGMATLTRTITFYYLVLVILFWIGMRVGRSRTVLLALAALAGFVAVTVPWMVRNHSAIGKATICTLTGTNLYVGNQPGSGMGYNVAAGDRFNTNDPSLEVYNDSVGWHEAWAYIADEPLPFVKRGVLKVGFFYASDFDPLYHWLKDAAERAIWDQYVILALVTESYYLIVLLLAATGVVIFFRYRSVRTPGGWLFLLTILMWTAVHFVFYAKGRYHFPIVPMLSAFAAMTVVRLSSQHGERIQ